MNNALAWTREQFSPPDDLRIAAVLHCGARDCNSVLKVPVGNLGSSPEWIRKLFERKGWRVDQHNQSLCRCPSCIRVRRVMTEPVKAQIADLVKGGKTIRDVASEVGRSYSSVHDVVRQVMPERVKTREREEMATTSKPAMVEISSIPAAVKTRIRQKLDATFDDAAGAYLNGATDLSVAEELGIAMAQVYSLREMAYGPIKRDVELDGLIAGIASLRQSMAVIQSEIDRLDTKAGAIIRRLGL